MIGFWKSQGPMFINGMRNPQCDPAFVRNKPGRATCIIMLPCEPGANSTTMTPACLANNTVCACKGVGAPRRDVLTPPPPLPPTPHTVETPHPER